MNTISSYLYAKPSFTEGIARLIDLGSTLQEYNASLTPDQADVLAILADWSVVGDDFRAAMMQHQEVQNQMTDELLAEACKALAVVE